MAKKLIARLPVSYDPADGSFTPLAGYSFEIDRMHEQLRGMAGGRPVTVRVEISPQRDNRTLRQNRLMWALLERMAVAYGKGGRDGVTAESCYLDLLADAGIKVEYWPIPLAAVDIFRRNKCVIQVVEMFDDKQCMVRVSVCSSQFSTAEMHDFIERIFDRLAEMGVNDAETTAQYREWRADDGKKHIAGKA